MHWGKLSVCEGLTETKNMRKVLIIDDDTPVQQMLALISGLNGMETTCTKSILEATQELGRQKFDICLLDVQLPDGYGIHLIDAIRTRSPETKIIITSGDAVVMQDVAQLYPDVTMIPKPFNASDFLPYFESR